uniref:TBC1 domain family member 31 n=1 Tax=Electrophorus electricus TaxID=8005 RepID=A0AAY5EYC4_ELEEL
MQTTDIGSKENGKLWQRKPVPSNNGILVNLIRNASSYQTKTVRFLHVAFDTTGESFLAGDHHGNIYLFDIGRNRFQLIQKTGLACTALAFNLRRTTEFLVALSDYSIKCYDKGRQLVSWMRGHEGAVSSLSVHASGRYAISTSSDTAQLWDLDTFQRKRKLNVRQSTGIQKVLFLPLSNTILSCFNDDSIFAWESDTLVCAYQLPVPLDGPRMHYKAFSLTQDGKMLATGGRTNLLHLWCLESRQLVRVIQMPQAVRTVRHLDFLSDSFDGGSSQILGVLSQDGIMRFINTETCKLLFSIGSHEDAITSAIVCPKGRHIAAVMDSGAVRVYSVRALTQEIHKPPQPLVRLVTGEKVADGLCLKMKVHAGTVRRPKRTSGCKIRTRLLQPPDVSTLEDKENDLPDGLNKKRLQTLLRTFGEYPAKYRMFIWRSLLRLPENHAAFSSLTEKGLHSAYLSLHEHYPIKSPKLQRGLQRVLSALAHWSAIFGETEYLPLLAFPFVKLFQNNPLICFEVVATVVVNWCQHWFEYFPNPPLNILSVVENMLAHHDKELLRHLVNCGVTSQLYAWPLLETLFSEVLTREEWLKLFDNVFSNHPSFLLMAAVAYVTLCRAPLLLCTHRDDFEYFFHHRNNLNISVMLTETYHLMETTPAELHPNSVLGDFEPLTRGQYPIFNKYPTFIVEYQCQERERIRQEEVEYLRERQALQEVRAEAVRQQAEDEAWYMQQDLLQQAEVQRRRLLQEEESKLAQQRARLAAMKRELKVKELTLLDAARRRFLTHQQNQRRIELHRLDDEIQRKAALQAQETAAAVKDMEVRQMELDAHRRLFEQRLAKEQERVSQEVKTEVEARRRKAELDDLAFHNLLQSDSDLNQETQRVLEESVAEVEQHDVDADWQTEVIGRLRRADEEQERRRQQLANLSRETLAKEQQLIQLMMKAEGKHVRGLSVTSYSSCVWNASAELICGDDVSRTVSLEHGRGKLDREEKALLQEVRELRQKLAARARAGDHTSLSGSSQH